MTRCWRVVIDEPLAGAENMVRDRAIQLAVEEGSSPPTLRLYRWLRPTVTLGRFQDVAGVDMRACERHGVDVVRRFTGGRGVLHEDEVTYSVVAGTVDGVPRGVAASYRHLASALVSAYAELGVQADLTTRDTGDRASAACYLQATRADLSTGSAKLSGSAQVWIGTTVLQHGSFTLSRNATKEAELFRLTPEQARYLASQTKTLVELTGARPSPQSVIEAVLTGFSDIMTRPATGELTRREAELAAGLGALVEVGVIP